MLFERKKMELWRVIPRNWRAVLNLPKQTKYTFDETYLSYVKDVISSSDTSPFVMRLDFDSSYEMIIRDS